MGLVLDVLGGLFVAAGIALIAIGGLGLLRLPDFYNRTNAVAKAAGLGLISVLFGALLVMPSWTTAVTLLLAILLQVVTAPVGAFALGNAAYRRGIPWR